MTTAQEDKKTATKFVPYALWQKRTDDLEREVHRLSWKAVCELRSGVPLDKVVKTADAANNAQLALMEYMEEFLPDHSSLTAPGASNGLPTAASA